MSFPQKKLKFLNGENSGGMQSKRIYKSCKCFFKPLNTNFSKFFAQIWHKKKKIKKTPTLFFRILRSVGRGQHNNVFFLPNECDVFMSWIIGWTFSKMSKFKSKCKNKWSHVLDCFMIYCGGNHYVKINTIWLPWLPVKWELMEMFNVTKWKIEILCWHIMLFFYSFLSPEGKTIQPYFGKRKQVTHYLYQSYWWFCVFFYLACSSSRTNFMLKTHVGKRKQMTYHKNLSYWCFHIL